MPRKPTRPCARCGNLLKVSQGTLPEGQATCHPCRRANPPRRYFDCETCGVEFTAAAATPRRFCGVECSRASMRIRSSDAPEDNRDVLMRSAPGLRACDRKRLMAKWIRQSRTCSYCPAKATSIDHVIPLVRGGTHFEGNLAPCCASCNSSKNAAFIVEWKTGHRPPRMRRSVIWETRAGKTKTEREPHSCPICSVLTLNQKYCTARCRREAAARRSRDFYRRRHGLPPAPPRPTASWH